MPSNSMWPLGFIMASLACTEGSVQLPASTATIADSLLAVTEPCTLVRMGEFRDGGSIGGILVDASGDSILFCYDQRLDRPEPHLLYLGKRWCGDPGAIGLPIESPQEEKLTRLLRESLHRLVSTSVAQRLQGIERSRALWSLSEEERRAWEAFEMIRLMEERR